jgi:hypothetical protein
LISTSKLRERLPSDILVHWMGHVTTFEHVSCSSHIQCSKAQNLSQTPKLIVPSRKHHLPLKTRNCAFSNAEKHGLISQFGLFNRFFSLELRTLFPKSIFCQKSRILTVLPNRPIKPTIYLLILNEI